MYFKYTYTAILSHTDEGKICLGTIADGENLQGQILDAHLKWLEKNSGQKNLENLFFLREILDNSH